MTCTCSRLKVGGKLTESRNWNPDCTEHGTDSEWYRSPDVVARRDEQRQRTIDLQRRAREARSKHAATPEGDDQ